jgi:hypothetical protein
MIIAMLVAVVPEMDAVVLRMLQRIAYAHDRRMGGVQRKQDSEQEAKRERMARTISDVASVKIAPKSKSGQSQ